MKTNPSIAVISLLMLAGTAFAQPIPAPAKATLARLYPAATRVKWETEAGAFEAGFSNKGQTMSLVIDAKGTVRETETAIPAASLPAPVRRYLTSRLPGQKIDEAAIIVDAGGRKTYEAEVNGKDYVFDVNGKLLTR